MFRRLLNFKLIQNSERYLLKKSICQIINTHNNKWNFQQFKAYPTSSTVSLYSSKNPEKNKELKCIQLEVSLLYEEGMDVPDPFTVTAEQWEHLLGLAKGRQRDLYLEYLNARQRRIKLNKEKREIRAENISIVRDERTEEIRNTKHIVYGLYANNLYLKIQDRTLKRWKNRKLFRVMKHGLKLIFDCSYDQYMSPGESKNTGKQLKLCFSANRQHSRPFDLHLCNIDPDGATMHAIHKDIPTLYNKSFPLNLHQKCFTKLFPMKNLVYLSPTADRTLQEFDPNDIYIIGGFVDTTSAEPLSLAKAKRLGIRAVRLPIEKYLQWGSSTKFLTLDQLCKILLDLRDTRDWNKALLHVPRRKLH